MYKLTQNIKQGLLSLSGVMLLWGFGISGESYLVSSYEYDVLGNKRSMVLSGNPEKGINGKTYWERDLFGNVYQKKLCIKNNAEGCPDYNTEPKAYYLGERFVYNEANQLIKNVNQLGFIESKPGTYEAHSYYANGLIKSSRDLGGAEFHYVYDASGQEVEHYLGSEENKHYRLVHCYDSVASRSMSVCLDATTVGLISPPYTGQLVALKEYWQGQLNNQINYTYTPDGKPSSIIYHSNLQAHDLMGHLNRVISMRYNEYGQVASRSDALNKVTLYEYDEYGRQIGVCIEGDINGECGSEQVKYHYVSKENTTEHCGNRYSSLEQELHSGKVQCITYSNNTEKEIRYDGYGRDHKVSLINRDNNQVLQSQTYHYNNITGNIEFISNHSDLDKSFNSNYTQHYQYNVLNQLIASHVEDVTGKQKGQLNQTSFVYDERGNLLNKSIKNPVGYKSGDTNYRYNIVNQLIGIESGDTQVSLCVGSNNNANCISYDSNGNMLTDGLGNHYEYNDLNQLIEFHDSIGNLRADYQYLANGMRASKQVKSELKTHERIYFYYDNSQHPQILNEVQTDRQHQELTTTHYLMSGGRSFRYYNHKVENKQSHTQLLQGHKSVLGELDSSKQFTEKYNYADYGKEIELAPPILAVKINKEEQYTLASNSFRYSSEYVDSESGLNYLRARYYHPELQVFPQRDSAPLLNRYQYGYANPIMMVDPSGHMPSMSAGFAMMGWALGDAIFSVLLIGTGVGYYFANGMAVSAGAKFFDAIGYFSAGKDVENDQLVKDAGITYATSFAGLGVEMGLGQSAKSLASLAFNGMKHEKAARHLFSMISEVGAAPFYSRDLYTGHADKAFGDINTYTSYMTGVLFAEGIAKPFMSKAVGLDQNGGFNYDNPYTISDINIKSNHYGINAWKKWAHQNFIGDLPSRQGFWGGEGNVMRTMNNRAHTLVRVSVSRAVYTARTLGRYASGAGTGSADDVTKWHSSEQAAAFSVVAVGSIVTAFLAF